MRPAGRVPPCTRRSYSDRLSRGRGEGICPSSAAAFADHLLEQVSGEKRDVRGALSETPHEIRIPPRSKWNVHPHAVAFTDQLVLEVAAHSVEHLELVALGRDVVGQGEPLRLIDDGFVVGGDAGVVPPQHQLVHAANVGRIDVLLVRTGDRTQILVRTLAEADASLEQNGALDVGERAVEIALHLSLIHISEPTRLGMISYAVF